MDSTVTKDHTQHYPSKEDPVTQDSDERPFKGLERDTTREKLIFRDIKPFEVRHLLSCRVLFRRGTQDGLLVFNGFDGGVCPTDRVELHKHRVKHSRPKSLQFVAGISS